MSQSSVHPFNALRWQATKIHRLNIRSQGHLWVPYFALAVGLAFTAAFAWYVRAASKANARQSFDYAVEKTVAAVEERLRDYIALLVDARRIFGVDREVRRDDFRAYAESLLLRTFYPGVQGIGFAMRVSPEEQPALIASMRRQGQPAFRIWPHRAEESFPIVFLEPLDIRNQAAMGYDMFTEPVRRAAMMRARATGEPSASGKVILVQEIDEYKQAGFLIFLPVYREGIVPLTEEERIASFRGFVYSPFRADDFFFGILGAQQSPPGVLFKVFDGTEPVLDNLLYISSNDVRELNSPSEFITSRSIAVAGRTWTLVLSSEPALSSGWLLQPWLLVIGMGGTISLLLFAVTRVQTLAFAAAERHAAAMRRSRQEALESEARKRAMFESALDCVITMDHEGKVVEFNPAAEKTFRYQKGEVIGRQLADLIIPPGSREKHREGMKRYTDSGKSAIIGRRIEVTAMRADGAEFPAELALTRVDINEQPLFTAYLRDITARKRSEELLRQVIESSPTAMVMTNADGEIVMVNGQTERLFGYRREELISRSIAMLVPDCFSHGYRDDLMETPRPQPIGPRREFLARRKDGSEFSVEMGINPLRSHDRTLVLSAIVDISAHKRSEDAMKSALREKEVLLKEVHHRVKNNLQIISSLLDLQAGSLRDPLVLQSIQESQHRIRSIALMHEKLYQQPDLTEVDFADYVHSLTAYLLRAYLSADGRVALNVHADHVRLRIDAAISCGLILNELVSNALKHAFPGRPGTITVAVSNQEPGRIIVLVRDDGVGLPPELDWRATISLGLRLVQTLTQQLHGTLTVDNSGGTSFELNFPQTEGEQLPDGERGNFGC
jgi:PAS domain S-box-containing protein